MTDFASEYGRLLAERDRLIASGVDPAELLVLDPLPAAMSTEPIPAEDDPRVADQPVEED